MTDRLNKVLAIIFLIGCLATFIFITKAQAAIW